MTGTKTSTVDSNGNYIVVDEMTGCYTEDGRRIVVVQVVGSIYPNRKTPADTGYLAVKLPGGSFGDENCPSSYNMPCITWFGPGERYTDVVDAIEAFAWRYRVISEYPEGELVRKVMPPCKQYPQWTVWTYEHYINRRFAKHPNWRTKNIRFPGGRQYFHNRLVAIRFADEQH